MREGEQEFKYSEEKHGVTYSVLRTWLQCRWKADLMVRGVTPKKTSDALDFGTIGHSILQVLYEAARAAYPNPWIPSDVFIEMCVEEVIGAFVEDQDIPDPDFEEQAEIYIGIFSHLIKAYVDFWRKDFLGDLKWLKVESEFMVPSPKNPKVKLRGKMDGVYESSKNWIWLLETKFKSRIDETNLMDALPMDLQVHIYLHALKHVMQKNPRGVLYNVVRRPALRRKQNESVEDYVARVGADIKKDPEKYFKRYQIRIVKSEMKEFVEELGELVNEFVMWRKGKLKTYKNGSECFNIFPCRYLSLCSCQKTENYYIRKRLFPELTVEV